MPKIISEELDKILDQEFKILDHGFIRIVDYMGDDSAIVQAARVSYGAGTKKVSEDKGLISYLMRHSHSTPFEMCEIKFHVKCPIFVARQWIRHRASSTNEYSARYSIVDNEYYVPEINQIAFQSIDNKQGRGKEVELELGSKIINSVKSTSDQQHKLYTKMLNEGVAREIARISLTLNYYTEFYWKVNLHNLMHFLKLRADNHAQYEIRVYALQIIEFLKIWVPHTYEDFINYKMEADNISKKMKDVVKRKIKGENITFETSGLNKREWNEFELSYLSNV